MNRRGLLGAMFAAASAPAFVKAGVLMPICPIWTPPKQILIGSDQFGWDPGIGEMMAIVIYSQRGELLDAFQRPARDGCLNIASPNIRQGEWVSVFAERESQPMLCGTLSLKLD